MKERVKEVVVYIFIRFSFLFGFDPNL